MSEVVFLAGLAFHHHPNPRINQIFICHNRFSSTSLFKSPRDDFTSHPEGGGKLPLLEWKLLLYFFRAYRYFEIKKRFMDEVIGMTSGYGCGKRRKSGTVGYLLNQSSDKPSQMIIPRDSVHQ
ncbi:hypothetical protein FXO38_05085 [Capsicum annuum]|nr:hypothetical protein FXO38_05085 [Capsicum annuum]KAF3682287.1 hypothetical protein FXO37_02424 [Capsicum annuum]